MKKVAKKQANRQVERKLDTVGVRGSIPRGPTITLKLDTSKSYVIPEGFEVIQALDWEDFTPRSRQIIRLKPRMPREKAVNKQKSVSHGNPVNRSN